VAVTNQSSKKGAQPNDDASSSGAGLSTENYNPVSLTVEESYALYSRAQKECPVLHSNARGGFYMLTRYDDVRAAALDGDLFSSAGGVGLPPGQSPGRIPALEMDPPEHGPWRRLFMEAITPATLKSLEPEIVALANSVIDDFAARGSCDLMREFAETLPVFGMCKAIGLESSDPEVIRQLAYDFTSTSGDPQRRKGVLERISALMMSEINDRRRLPREDYLTRVALAEFDGQLINEPQLQLFLSGFLVAGHESTASALASLLFYTLSNPALRVRLPTDDDALVAAVEEAIRLHAPFQGFSRTTTAATQVGGVNIAEGQVVRLCFAAANRDPKVFEDPDKFDIDRPKKPHMGFGLGRHLCAGAHLARLEVRIAVRQLLQRLPDIALLDQRLEWELVGGVLAAPRALRATFTPRSRDSQV
jgi:cytochrome P450